MRLSPQSMLAYVALLVSALLYSLHISLSQPPQVVSADAPASLFSAERALTVLKDLLQQDQPHPIGSAANQFVRSRIEARLNELGIEYVIQAQWACRFQSNRCAMVENVIATIPGETKQDSILLMAHYDSVPTTPGAGDDAAAVAAILETARSLAIEAPLPRPVVLLFTDGEESGLLGAEAFFQDKDLTRNIGVVLNYEGSGSKGVSRVLRTAPRGSALIDLYQQSAKPATGNSLSNEIFKRMPNDTDFSTVIRSGLSGIDFAFADERNHYHTRNDSIANLDLSTLQHHGNNMLPMVRQLLATEQLTEDGPLVYTDPYGFWLQWPASWQPILVLLAALIIVAAVRFNQTSTRQLVISIATSALSLFSAMAGGLLAFNILERLLGPLPGWPAQLWSFRLVLFAAPVFSGLIVVWLFQRWLQPLGLYTGALLWLLVISGCLTALMPDAANIFILALFPASIALFIGGFAPPHRRMYINLVALITIIPATIGLVEPVEASQGYGLVIAIIPGVALFVIFLLPFLFGALRSLTIVSLLATCTGMIWSLSEPLYSEQRPQAINFIWYQNQDSGESYLTIQHQGRLPPKLQEGVTMTPTQLLPFSDRAFAPWMKLPGVLDGGAGVQIVERKPASVALRLHTRKNIAAVRFYLPASAELSRYTINSQSFTVRPGKQAFDLIELIGLYGATVDLELEFAGATPDQAFLANLFYPMPLALRPFQALRDPLGNPVHQGDQAVSFRSIELTK